MPKRLRLIACFWFGCVLLLTGGGFARAEPASDDTRRLLEKSLTVYELDREIARLGEEEERLTRSIRENAALAERANERVEERKRHAGRVLRSVYTGERSTIWMTMLHARSLKDALLLWEQLRLILERDERMLDAYLREYRTLKEMNAKLEADRRELAGLKAAFVAERERRLAAEREVQRELAARADKDRIEQEMKQLVKRWEERGLPLFTRTFSALADAMPNLPELFKQNNRMLTASGFNYTFQIGDEELNRFLRDKNKELDGFAFSFRNDRIDVGGRKDGVEMTVSGRYVVEQEPENAVRFRIDALTFDGFALPESTFRQLERQFDLAFYPRKIAPFLQATDVRTESGKLTVLLKMTF